LLERVLERPNLQRALKQVRQNKGAPGIVFVGRFVGRGARFSDSGF